MAACARGRNADIAKGHELVVLVALRIGGADAAQAERQMRARSTARSRR